MKKNRWLSFAFTACAVLGAAGGCRLRLSSGKDAPPSAGFEEQVNALIAETVCTGDALTKGLKEAGVSITDIQGGGMDEEGLPYLDFTAWEEEDGYSLGHAVCDVTHRPPIQVFLYNPDKYIRL